ncbi:nonstructural protein [Microviridae sp.]|nr:nonstructural protein [Microviridae sp.]
MITQVFSIYDSKTKIYNKPIFLLNEAEAKRALTDLLADKTSTLALHPEDYSLWHLGSFDDSTGYFTEEKHVICHLSELSPNQQISDAEYEKIIKEIVALKKKVNDE